MSFARYTVVCYSVAQQFTGRTLGQISVSLFHRNQHLHEAPDPIGPGTRASRDAKRTPGRARRSRATRQVPMKKELFAELMRSVGEAAEHASGKRDLRTTILPELPAAMSAADVRRMRKALNASQAVFARCLNVSPQLVRAWEADRRHPDGAALRLLEIGRLEPAVVFPALVGAEARASSRKNTRPSVRSSVVRDHSRRRDRKVG